MTFELAPEVHRQIAVAAHNRAWELIDKSDRVDADEHEMLRMTFASRFHWEFVGGDEERAIGDWQIAHVGSLVRDALLALRFAQSALDIVTRNGWSGWRLASCYEGLARAYAVAGDPQQRDRYVALAEDELQRVDDQEDRQLIASQLATIPRG